MKIICIGRNYADHAKELNNEVQEEPIIFLKPDTAIITGNKPFFHPEFSQNIHHELELVVKINRIGKHIEPRFAHKYYNEVTVGIDFTARDLQTELKTKGLPWERAKAFDGSAPLGEFVTVESLGKDIQALNIRLEKNGSTVQNGTTANMMHTVNNIIAYVSQYFTLKIGDLIYTGTPAGVSKVEIGDNLKGYLEEQCLFDFNIR